MTLQDSLGACMMAGRSVWEAQSENCFACITAQQGTDGCAQVHDQAGVVIVRAILSKSSTTQLARLPGCHPGQVSWQQRRSWTELHRDACIGCLGYLCTVCTVLSMRERCDVCAAIASCQEVSKVYSTYTTTAAADDTKRPDRDPMMANEGLA